MITPPLPSHGAASATVVLDTNVVLDWLLFKEPRLAGLGAAVHDGRLRWVVCPRMREEFRRTLLRPVLQRWRPDGEQLLTRFDQQARMLPDPIAAPARLRCDDASDQIFVDLALACSAGWLLSHDKALLRLRRRMPLGGPIICRPADWLPAAGGSG